MAAVRATEKASARFRSTSVTQLELFADVAGEYLTVAEAELERARIAVEGAPAPPVGVDLNSRRIVGRSIADHEPRTEVVDYPRSSRTAGAITRPSARFEKISLEHDLQEDRAAEGHRVHRKRGNSG